MDQQTIDAILISIAGFIAVYTLVRLMQVYRQRLVFETREIFQARIKANIEAEEKKNEESDEQN